MKFSKEYSKLNYPIFTTIRQNKGFYEVGMDIKIYTPKQQFYAQIVSIRNIALNDITDTIAKRDADCGYLELRQMMKNFYKNKASDLILITLMKV